MAFRRRLRRKICYGYQGRAFPHSKYASFLYAPRRVLNSDVGACAKLGIKPAITIIIVVRRHHVRFFPRSENDGARDGNCPAGTVVDSDVVNPIEFNFYLLSHGPMTGTSRPAHYNVLIDENNFTYAAFLGGVVTVLTKTSGLTICSH